MHPQVAAATGAVMVLFSSSAAVFQFALPGRLNPGYAGLFAATSIAGSLLGILLVARFVRRTGRTSIIVLILGAVIALGGLVAGVFGAIDAADRFRSGTGTSFTDLCQSLS